jgi:hypothetical protein|tara:strand:- start:256 stop:417 length:162 start_codon:yes stop_codon:yes gene_type:complete
MDNKRLHPSEKLIDLVLDQIEKDFAKRDVTAIVELLKKVDVFILESFLSEEIK